MEIDMSKVHPAGEWALSGPDPCLVCGDIPNETVLGSDPTKHFFTTYNGCCSKECARTYYLAFTITMGALPQH